MNDTMRVGSLVETNDSRHFRGWVVGFGGSRVAVVQNSLGDTRAVFVDELVTHNY